MIEFGALSGWVDGVGSLLAVSVALYYSKQQRRESNDERLRSVFAWVERDSDGRWSLVVHNRTAHPIQRWLVTLAWAGTEDVAEGTAGVDSVDSEVLGLLLPGENRYAWSAAPGTLVVDSGVLAAIEFIDATGRQFGRSAAGGLKRRRRRTL